MCSGKVHGTIGLLSGVAVAEVMTHTLSLPNSIIPIIGFGGLVGGLIVDIDSKRSKASQAFNKVLTLVCALYLAEHFLGPSVGVNVNQLGWLKMFLNGTLIKNMFFGALLVTLIVLGHLSPHRVFTHKWFGTACFLIIGFFALNKYFFIGYALGYVLHLIADALLTKEDLRFTTFSLPLHKSDGEFHIVL